MRLQLTKKEGGRALPCLENYYKSAQIRILISWCDPSCDARWKEIDQAEVKLPLPAILGNKRLLQSLIPKVLPLIKTPPKIWFNQLKDKSVESHAKLLGWPAHDETFTPAKLDSRFKLWSTKGITAYWKISNDKGLMSFQQLSEMYKLGREDFYRYLQLRHHFNADIVCEKEKSPLILLFIDVCKGLSKKQVSSVYSILQSERKLSTTYIKQRWEKEVGINLSEEEWLNICKTITTTSCSDLWREFTWKNTLRFFITPKIRAQQTKTPVRGSCWRKCGQTTAGHFHIFWECPNIAPYWKEVLSNIQLIIGLQFEETFSVFYLGNLPTGLRKEDRYLLQILQVASKKAITRKWLNEDPPNVSDWIKITNEIHTMERLTFSLRQASDKGELYWKKWRHFISK